MTGTWFGGGDHGTKPMFFYYNVDQASDLHLAQMSAVRARLEELTKMRDANESPVVKMIYSDEGPATNIVAYRFTSDWAERCYYGELRGLASSLGCAVWQPFGCVPSGDVEMRSNY